MQMFGFHRERHSRDPQRWVHTEINGGALKITNAGSHPHKSDLVVLQRAQVSGGSRSPQLILTRNQAEHSAACLPVKLSH